MCLCVCLHLIGMYWRLEPKEMSSKNLKIFIRIYNLVYDLCKIERNENYLWCLLIPPINSCSLLPIDLPLPFPELSVQTSIWYSVSFVFYLISYRFQLIFFGSWWCFMLLLQEYFHIGKFINKQIFIAYEHLGLTS